MVCIKNRNIKCVRDCIIFISYSLQGMGQSQMRLVKTLAAPTEFAVLSPGGTYQPFKARLVWINAKSLTLMLPNGRENRFQI